MENKQSSKAPNTASMLHLTQQKKLAMVTAISHLLTEVKKSRRPAWCAEEDVCNKTNLLFSEANHITSCETFAYCPSSPFQSRNLLSRAAIWS
mmetsp:Transcript_18129/g.35627  ORF Transcript_18129/g.35627 Transcript_18129/m.35627 type:complete len:93 (+) Transcript_18129:581-859(+)